MGRGRRRLRSLADEAGLPEPATEGDKWDEEGAGQRLGIKAPLRDAGSKKSLPDVGLSWTASEPDALHRSAAQWPGLVTGTWLIPLGGI